MLNHRRQDLALVPVSPSLKKKASASANPFVSLLLQLFVLLALTLLLLPFQTVLIQMHLSSLLVYLLFVVTAITGLRGRHTLRSKGITLFLGIAGIHVLVDWLLALRRGQPFGVALFALYAYLTVFLVFGFLALFWWVAYRFLLRASSPSNSSHAPSLSTSQEGREEISRG